MIIVLVGSPMSGKTTLLKKLQERGVKVFHTDSFIKKMYKKNQPGYELIKNFISEEFVNDNGVDKKKLAIWCSKEKNLMRLNEIIHPLIFDYLNDKDNYVAELPIASSSPVNFNYDKIVLVKSSKEVINKRFIKSNIDNKPFIEQIINSWQKFNKENFDYVVDTSDGIKEYDINKIISMLN